MKKMSKLKITTNPEFEAKLESYPDFVRDKLKDLRTLVIETAEEIPEITDLEETLKWGEISFVTKTGSTLRMDWKKKTPNQYQMYFKCTSRLVETFVAELKKCIKATLMYHKVKEDLTLEL